MLRVFNLVVRTTNLTLLICKESHTSLPQSL